MSDSTGQRFVPVRPATNVVGIPSQINLGMWTIDAGGTALWGPIPGDAEPSPPPGYATQLTDIVSVALAEDYVGPTTYSLRRDGTVWAQGVGERGQLGDGTQGQGRFAPQPVQVSNLTGVVQIAADSGNGYALKADGTVWAWGDYYAGGLAGFGPPSSSFMALTPIQVPGLANIVSIASDSAHFAVRADGTVWVWGCAVNGKTGDGSAGTVLYSVQQVPGLSDIKTIDTDFGAVFAIDGQGHVQAWGWNPNNSTGTGAPEVNILSPKPLPGVTGAVAVTAGMAMRSDGRLYVWNPGPPTLVNRPIGVLSIDGAGLVLAEP